MDKEVVNKILKEMEAGYDLMAEKFSQTRKFFWRGTEFISNYAKEGDRILDYGCGNGRLLELFILRAKLSEYTGVDVSQELIKTAKDKYGAGNIKFQKISGLGSLPFSNDFFNITYSIAVFHHLPSKELRIETVKELYRVTKPGGYIIITVWNLWQWNYIKNIFQNYINKLIYGCKLDWNDCYITFKNNQGDVFNRYHHAFTKRELKKLFSQTGFEVEKCDIINSRNILIIAKK
jgi:ubiquinone/menaquinone biosynthesis C-methylase UbiE